MENINSNFDLVIIGAGPGGYTAAIKAAQLGLKTAIVEKDKNLGGTCLNVGCIPSKALLSSTELYHEAQKQFGSHGISVDGLSMDVSKMMKRKDRVVRKMARGVDYLMNKNGIERVVGLGRIAGPDEVEVTGDEGQQKLKAKRILIATGSRVAGLPFLEFDGETVLSSDDAVALGQAPKSMVVIGGGAIGGAIIGGILGGRRGAAIGGSGGAGAGTAAALAAARDPAVLPRGAAVTVRITAPTTIILSVE